MFSWLIYEFETNILKSLDELNILQLYKKTIFEYSRYILRKKQTQLSRR